MTVDVTGDPPPAVGGKPSPGPSGPPRRTEPATSFVGTTMEDDGSVTILLRGRCDRPTTDRVAEHIDCALARGARFLTIEIIGPLAAGEGLCALLGRTQARVADRRGLLVVRGLRPHMLDSGPAGEEPFPPVVSPARPSRA